MVYLFLAAFAVGLIVGAGATLLAHNWDSGDDLPPAPVWVRLSGPQVGTLRQWLAHQQGALHFSVCVPEEGTPTILMCSNTTQGRVLNLQERA